MSDDAEDHDKNHSADDTSERDLREVKFVDLEEEDSSPRDGPSSLFRSIEEDNTADIHYIPPENDDDGSPNGPALSRLTEDEREECNRELRILDEAREGTMVRQTNPWTEPVNDVLIERPRQIYTQALNTFNEGSFWCRVSVALCAITCLTLVGVFIYILTRPVDRIALEWSDIEPVFIDSHSKGKSNDINDLRLKSKWRNGIYYQYLTNEEQIPNVDSSNHQILLFSRDEQFMRNNRDIPELFDYYNKHDIYPIPHSSHHSSSNEKNDPSNSNNNNMAISMTLFRNLKQSRVISSFYIQRRTDMINANTSRFYLNYEREAFKLDQINPLLLAMEKSPNDRTFDSFRLRIDQGRNAQNRDPNQVIALIQPNEMPIGVIYTYLLWENIPRSYHLWWQAFEGITRELLRFGNHKNQNSNNDDSSLKLIFVATGTAISQSKESNSLWKKEINTMFHNNNNNNDDSQNSDKPWLQKSGVDLVWRVICRPGTLGPIAIWLRINEDTKPIYVHRGSPEDLIEAAREAELVFDEHEMDSKYRSKKQWIELLKLDILTDPYPSSSSDGISCFKESTRKGSAQIDRLIQRGKWEAENME